VRMLESEKEGKESDGVKSLVKNVYAIEEQR